nr:MAG TPA: hypothetical protein [Caudoviricetes sp.]
MPNIYICIEYHLFNSSKLIIHKNICKDNFF